MRSPVALVLLPLLAGLTMASCGTFPCARREEWRLEAPTRDYVAIHAERNCHATAPFQTEVLLARPGDSVSAARSVIITRYAASLDLKWQSDTLVIRLPDGTDIERRRKRVGDIQIRYE